MGCRSVIGLGLAATGGALIYWGVHQQKRAHPNTKIGVMLRRSAEIQVRRSW
jgi:hypothetical protein